MPKIKQGFKMELLAFNINASCSSYARTTRKADFIDFDCTRTRILNYFNLIGGRLCKPFVSDLVIENNIPYTFLPCMVLFFTSKNNRSYHDNGNEKFNHMREKRLITSNIEATLISNNTIAGDARFFDCNSTPACVLYFLNLIIRRFIDDPCADRSAAFHGFIIAVGVSFLFASNCN